MEYVGMEDGGWRMEYGGMEYGIWSVGYGGMEYGIWSVGYGVWSMMYQYGMCKYEGGRGG
jgi:hypothetical protein